jgi:ATP-dependent Clp protease protease subunit
MSLLIPTVVEPRPHGERAVDIYSRLLRERIVFLASPIDEDKAGLVVAQWLCLESEDPERAVPLYINSPGGVTTAGGAIYDTIQYIRPAVSTVCIGVAASMGAVLLAEGAPGRRFALREARVLIDAPWVPGQLSDKVTDLDIAVDELRHTRAVLSRLLSHHTGQPRDQVRADIERDRWMSAREAETYGLIDQVMPARAGEESAGAR